MRIAQVAPLIESVPPRLYGGTERVVAFLTDELVAQGHDVTLFATGDSTTRGKLVPIWPTALRLDGTCRDTVAPHLVMLEEVARQSDDFDVVHFHAGHLHLPLARRLEVPHLTTLHGRLDLPELRPLFAEYDDIPLVSISNAQRIPLPGAHWVSTVYHGLPTTLLTFQATPDDYVAFLGRISPEKRVDRAIAIAQACGCRIRIAAKVDDADRAYFEREIRPLLDTPGVEFISEIGDAEKNDFLGRARALLFPIDWPEPFGLVMIEALACGTPVVAFRGGSVAEVIEDSVTGFVVNSIDEAAAALRRIGGLDRRRCRAEFERRFSAARMAADHVQLYELEIARQTMVPGAA